jgi:trigger factor
MLTQVEELTDNRVRLTVEVPQHDVHHAVEHAAADLASSVKIPGFRTGKVPMPVLVARFGRERIYQEAVESHIGGWFWNAAARSRIQPVEQPQYEYDLPASAEDDWRFTATVAVQPKPEIADWTQLEVGAPEPEVPQEAIDNELEVLRRSVAQLVPVDDRAALPGDTVVVDLVADDGEAQRDYVVELGAGRLLEEIEQALVGAAVGDSKDVSYELADGATRTLTATVKEIYDAVLPAVDDEFAQAASEFDTADELRSDIESRLRELVSLELEGRFREAAVDALVAASDVQAAGPLVEARTSELLRGLVRSLQQRGIDPNTYFSMTGQSPEQLQERVRAEASQAVARELVLEAVAEKAGVDVPDEEVEALIREQATAAGEDPADVTEQLRHSGAYERLRDDLRLRAALDHVAAGVQRIDPDLASAREKLWTPEKEKPERDTKLWTPASKESA